MGIWIFFQIKMVIFITSGRRIITSHILIVIYQHKYPHLLNQIKRMFIVLKCCVSELWKVFRRLGILSSEIFASTLVRKSNCWFWIVSCPNRQYWIDHDYTYLFIIKWLTYVVWCWVILTHAEHQVHASLNIRQMLELLTILAKLFVLSFLSLCNLYWQ